MRLAVLWLVAASPSWCGQAPSRDQLLEALNHAAETFARTAPGLGARELLSQRGRRMSFIKGKSELRDQFVLADDFEKHEVDSAWHLTESGALHEVREIRLIDAAPPDAGEVRHTLTLGGNAPETKILLEDLEHGRLEGAATDFVPILLLFETARQPNYEFGPPGRHKLGKTAAWVLHYRQIAGDDTFTEFRDRSEVRRPAEGEIWFRQSDLLPVRVTMAIEEVLSVRYILLNEARVDYTPSPFGLAPAIVLHRQYLNRDLVTENRFRYTDLTGRPIQP